MDFDIDIWVNFFCCVKQFVLMLSKLINSDKRNEICIKTPASLPSKGQVTQQTAVTVQLLDLLSMQRNRVSYRLPPPPKKKPESSVIVLNGKAIFVHLQTGGNAGSIGQQKQQKVPTRHVKTGRGCCFGRCSMVCFKWSFQVDVL